MSRAVLLIISAALVILHISTVLAKLPIISGDVASIKSIPYQVAILDRFGGHFCGGSLIGSRWVLTAAHCVDSATFSRLRVRVGSSHHAKGGKVFRVARRIVHPGWNLTVEFDSDLALLQLAARSALPDSVPLASEVENVTEGTLCTASGWGSTEDARKSEKLRSVQLPIADQAECAENYGKRGLTLTESMVCAGFREGGKDTCEGDSGGPLVCNGKLLGVTSFGINCAARDYYGVYAFVPAARAWIREQTGI